MPFAVYRSIAEAAAAAPDAALACGAFDGVHIGHRAVFAAARRESGTVLALTFEPHPLAVIAPEKALPAISSLEDRLELFAECGLDGAIVLPFTRELAGTDAAEFARRCFGAWRSPAVFSGANWTFGAGGSGRIADVARLSGGAARGVCVPFAEYKGEAVSSSRIRAAIAAGGMEDVEAMLARPYSVSATAAQRPSRGVGTSLGAPTANFTDLPALMPPLGVYVVDVRARGAVFRGVADYGFRPTFPDARPGAPLLEVHLLDYDGAPLYGEKMRVAFRSRLRDEMKFADSAALAARIAEDVALARAFGGKAAVG